MVDYLLADFAVSHLDGMYIGGFSREGRHVRVESAHGPGVGVCIFVFRNGTRRAERLARVFGSLEVPLAGHHLPHRGRTGRSRSFAKKRARAERDPLRRGEKSTGVQANLHHEDYGLGSLQGGILQPIQQSTWACASPTVRRTVHDCRAFHPYWSSKELAMFFPEEEKILIDDVSRSKGTYNQDTKWDRQFAV